MLNRRQFLGRASAAAFAASIAQGSRAAEGNNKGDKGNDYGLVRYARAVVVDACGGMGEYDPSLPDDAPLTARGLADVRQSGVTLLNVTVNPVGNGPDKFRDTIKQISGYEYEFNAHPDVLMRVRNGADIRLAKSSKRLGVVYGCQDTTMLEGDLKNLKVFADLGVRIVQPTYNVRNLMGDGCIETADGGLSKLGYDFVAEMNRLHLLLDLSHAGARTIAEGIAASKAPMAITHTGCRDLVDLPRNTRDSELKAMAARGGVAGMYFMPFLRLSGQPHAEDLIRHLKHAVDVCGEDHVGIGTDGSISGVPLTPAYLDTFRKSVEERQKAGISAPGESPDVVTVVPEYNDPLRYSHLADDLARQGWPASRIDKILGANFARLFAEVWGAPS
jgi:membrane dipeptidase